MAINKNNIDYNLMKSKISEWIKDIKNDSSLNESLKKLANK